MAQQSVNQRGMCPKCRVRPGEPCVTLTGVAAKKVHYGRPRISAERVEPLGIVPTGQTRWRKGSFDFPG